MNSALDVFVDLSNSGLTSAETSQYISLLASEDGIGLMAEFVTCVLPSDAGPDGAPQLEGWAFFPSAERRSAAQQSLKRAGLTGAEWLLLFAPVLPAPDAIGRMREALRQDPYFGFAIPRICSPDGTLIATPAVGPPRGVLSRRSLAELPEIVIWSEALAFCILTARSITANLETLTPELQDTPAALLDLLVRARRVGYRPIVDNRAVVQISKDFPQAPVASASAIAALDRLWPECVRARSEVEGGQDAAWERLAASVYDSGSNSPRKTLLIDARGMPAGFNGTAEFTLGMLDGIQACYPHGWDITVLVNFGVEAHHRLRARYPSMTFTLREEAGLYSVALRSSQPWFFTTMFELHQMAMFNVYTVYDTIAWDTVYPAPRALNESWNFMAEHSDGIVSIFDFTRRIFRRRFPRGHAGGDHVYYPSLDARDYSAPETDAGPRSGPDEPYILIVGNEYDHKGLAPALRALGTAFPFMQVRAFGAQSIGEVPQCDVDSLYRSAEVVVFPSFYEGFGFPMIRALSYGKAVVVRNSELGRELAERYSGPGRLRYFNTYAELVWQTGSLLHGVPGADAPLATRVESVPLSWKESSSRLLAYLDDLVRRPVPERWAARDCAIRQLTAFAS